MNTYKKVSKVFLSIVIMSAFTLTGVISASANQGGVLPSQALAHMPVCAQIGSKNNDGAHCHSHVVVGPDGKPAASNLPAGYGPKEFHAAYGSQTTVSGNKIIAIVDAYDNPTITSDLTKYSQTFGIPVLPTCSGSIASSAVPCFSKIDQRGGSTYPVSNAGWALESALDVETTHAMCQNCSILLVESDDNGFNALGAAENQAVAQGATVISNSWGTGEFNGVQTLDSFFNHPGVAITVSTGDSGYGVQYPASSPYVTAVGGTTLSMTGNGNYDNETAWNGAGSGCSAYESKPSWQTDSGCAMRMVADVSADADPSTGAAVYDSFSYKGKNGWLKVGGTSLAAPLIAGIYALANDVPASTQAASLPYTKYSLSNLNDIISGSNGSCGGTYLCTALAGFDGPTGLGTPKGLGAF